MIKLKNNLQEDAIKRLSLQQALDGKLFGPVYHGTSKDAHSKIDQYGFKVFVGDRERSGNISHGYQIDDYFGGIPAPLHHLGFGIYFTTSRTIAKKYNHGTLRGLKPYFLKTPKLEVINFGAPRTMMEWWIKNGYDYKRTELTTIGPHGNKDAILKERHRATLNLTETLKSKYDAVWFKGKGFRGGLLDGDQVCTYDPSTIFVIDEKMSQPGEVGSKVRRKADGMNGRILSIRWNSDAVKQARELQIQNVGKTWLHPETTKVLAVKWARGGSDHNVQDVDLEFL